MVETIAAPISIDAAEFTRHATAPETDADIAALTEQFARPHAAARGRPARLAKGIVERLLAVEMLLERDPGYRTSIAFLQVAVPSRDNVREYRQLRAAVEQHIGRINGRFTEPGNDVPVHYLYRGLSQQQLAAYYAVADALLVTPLIDGMNLVCKEYVTVQQAREEKRDAGAQRVHRRGRGDAAGDLLQPVRRGGAVYRIESALAAAGRRPADGHRRDGRPTSAPTTCTGG